MAKRAILTQPSLRTYRLWTPGQIRAAEALADHGNLRHVVDLCDWILADDRVNATLSTRVDAMLSSRVTFDGAGDRRRRKSVERALEVEDDYWSMLPDGELRQTLKWAIVLGFGSSYLDWQRKPGHAARDLPVLTFFHPQPITFDTRTGLWMRRQDHGLPEQIDWGSGLWVGHMPHGTLRPWSLGAWRGLSRWVLLKAFAISDYGRAGDLSTRNVVELDKDVESRVEQRRELSRQIFAMERDGAIVLPPGHHYRTVEQSATTQQIYQQQVNLANEAIAIAIRGGNLTTNVKDVGSKAATEAQERTGDAVIRAADATAWEVTVHDQVLTHWARSNFGDGTLAPWPVYETRTENKSEKATTMGVAMTGALQAVDLGFELDHEALANEFGLEKFLKPPSADAAPPKQKAPAPAPNEEEPGDEKPQGKARQRLRLMSGSFTGANSGFIDGQLFADSLVESATEESDEALAPTLDAVLEELESATDYDDLRARLRARYAALSPTALSDLVYRAMVLAELGGAAAVNQDVS